MRNNIHKQSQNSAYSKKVYNLRVEKLVREASDNFIYYRDYETVLEQVNEALKVERDNVGALVLKGKVLLSISQKNEALDYFDRALNINPCSVEANGAKASALDLSGRQVEALACCEKAFNYSTKKEKHLMPSLHEQKLSILVKLKRFEQARNFLSLSLLRLSEEDGGYLFSRYKGAIESICKERRKKREKVSRMSLRILN